MGTHLGSHQELLSLLFSLGPHLVWWQLCPTPCGSVLTGTLSLLSVTLEWKGLGAPAPAQERLWPQPCTLGRGSHWPTGVRQLVLVQLAVGDWVQDDP